MDDESRDILDVAIPILYDIRQQVDTIVTPYLKDVKKIYITGTGAIISNIDLYFNEIFLDHECEVIKPFFIYRDEPNIKEIMEVNSAIALALDGVGMSDPDLDFNAVAKKAAGVVTAKKKIEEMHLKEKVQEYKKKTIRFIKGLNAPVKKKKRNVAFDEGLLENSSNIGIDEDDELENVKYGRIDAGLVKLASFSASFLLAYCIASTIITNQLTEKTSIANREIARANSVITAAQSDAAYLKSVADDYVEVTNKLSSILVKINQSVLAQGNNFDIPNFLSELMFIMPSSVRVTSINVDKIGNVKIEAESGQYAQLGYFVSKLKLAEVLKDVDMQVVSDSGSIKIIVSGVMP